MTERPGKSGVGERLLPVSSTNERLTPAPHRHCGATPYPPQARRSPGLLFPLAQFLPIRFRTSVQSRLSGTEGFGRSMELVPASTRLPATTGVAGLGGGARNPVGAGTTAMNTVGSGLRNPTAARRQGAVYV